MTHSPRCAAVTWHQLPCIPSRMPRAPCSARPALAPVAHSCLGARPTRRRPIASSRRLPCGWLTTVSASQPPTTPASSCRSDPRGCVDTLPGPHVARAPVLRPSNLAAGEALPLLLFVLFLAHAFLRDARQEGPPCSWLTTVSASPTPSDTGIVLPL